MKNRIVSFLLQSKLLHSIANPVIITHKAAHMVFLAKLVIKPHNRFAAACGIDERIAGFGTGCRCKKDAGRAND